MGGEKGVWLYGGSTVCADTESGPGVKVGG